MATGDAADDAIFLQVSHDDTNKFIYELKNYNKKRKSDLKNITVVTGGQ